MYYNILTNFSFHCDRRLSKREISEYKLANFIQYIVRYEGFSPNEHNIFSTNVFAVLKFSNRGFFNRLMTFCNEYLIC